MSNDDKKKEEKGLRVAMIGILIIIFGVGIGYFDFVQNRVTNTAVWIGIFVVFAGIIINGDIVIKKMKNRK